eukprot:Nk52_evm1s604 gene=Nk52_evmTU1s604
MIETNISSSSHTKESPVYLQQEARTETKKGEEEEEQGGRVNGALLCVAAQEKEDTGEVKIMGGKGGGEDNAPTRPDIRPALGDNFESNFFTNDELPENATFSSLNAAERDIERLLTRLSDLGYCTEKYEEIDKLDLRGMGFRTWPPQLFHMCGLTWLSMEGNELEDIPDDICQLDRLQWLDVRNNKISQISPKLSELESLKTLLLQDNLIRRVPHEIGMIKSLKALSLIGNPLEFPPVDVVHKGVSHVLKHLRHFVKTRREASPEPVADDDHGFWRKSKSTKRHSSGSHRHPPSIKAPPVPALESLLPPNKEMKDLNFDEKNAIRRQLEEEIFKSKQEAEIERKKEYLMEEKRRKEKALKEKLRKAKEIEEQKRRLDEITEKKRSELQGMSSLIADCGRLESSRERERFLQRQEKERISSNIRGRFAYSPGDPLHNPGSSFPSSASLQHEQMMAQKDFESSLKNFDKALENVKREPWNGPSLPSKALNKNTARLDPLPNSELGRKKAEGHYAERQGDVPVEWETRPTEEASEVGLDHPQQKSDNLKAEEQKMEDVVSSMEKYKIAKAKENDKMKNGGRKKSSVRSGTGKSKEPQMSLLKQKIEMEKKKIQDKISKKQQQKENTSLTEEEKPSGGDFEFNAYDPDVTTMFPSSNGNLQSMNATESSTSPVA